MSEQVSRAELRERTRGLLREEWERYAAELPTEAIAWEQGAAYVRESGANSMVSDAPTTQLVSTLRLLAAERAYVAWEHVFFENASASEIATRHEFQSLIERARAGEFAVIGAYVSNRLFRNAEEAATVKRDLRKHGIRLVWTGKVNMDPRDPMSWSMERAIDTNDELHSRQTGWLVGRAYEFKSRRGEPAARVPEMWHPVEWAPGLRGGRHGRPIRWELTQPLADHVREGARRYLAGASTRDLAAWSGELGIQTPAGRPLAHDWWRRQLKNPKVAGFQYASEYMGYKPGKESPPRKPLAEREIVPCVLPPLITWEDFNAVQAEMRSRKGVAQKRPTYQIDLLSGIAYDASCGHKMFIRHRHGQTGAVFMLCNADRLDDRHAQAFRTGEAAEQVDALIGSLRFDEALMSRIEDQLDQLTVADQASVAPPSPETMQLRAALAALDDVQFSDLRQSLEERLRRLEMPVPQPVAAPARRFKLALNELRNWSQVWALAKLDRKNELLRSAGLKVYVERIEPAMNKARRQNAKAKVRHQTEPPFCRIVRIECEVPEFALALAAATSSEDPPTSMSVSTWISTSRLVALPAQYRLRLATDGRPRGLPRTAAA